MDAGIKEREIDNEEYIRDAFLKIEKGIRKAFVEKEDLVFESTGQTDYFDSLLSNIRRDYKEITIKVLVDLSVCLKRVHTCDQTVHINVSDEEVEKVNNLVTLKNLKTYYEINNNRKSTEEIIIEIKEILTRTVSCKGIDNC